MRLQLATSLILLFTVGIAAAQDTAAPDGSNASESKLDAVLNELTFSSRVLGGGDAEDNEWPSIVALVRTGAVFALEDRLFCGGTMVADRWVLTAAHCMYDSLGRVIRPSTIRAVGGINDLVEDVPDEEVVVTNIYIHPDYDNSKELPPSDLALLELANVPLNMPPTTLFSGETESEEYVNAVGFIAGWGAIEYFDESNAQYPTKLQDASVPLVSLATCNAPESYGGMVTSKQLCAGHKEGMIDTCSGDSGGPLFIIEDGVAVQVGITSFGNGCGLPDYYGIYTNVSHFIPWLSNYISTPYQSPELIAEREAGIMPNAPAVTSSSESGVFGASVQPVAVFVLAIFGFLRISSSTMNSTRRCTQSRAAWLAALSIMMVSGCSANATLGVPDKLAIGTGGGMAANNSIQGDRIVNDSNENGSVVKVKNSPTSLAVNVESGRPGVGFIRIGDQRDSVLIAVQGHGFSEPDCKAGKTALKGTGRLFLTEICDISAGSEQLLASQSIEKIALHFLDMQLIRLDVVMTEEGASQTLASELDAQFNRLKTATLPVEWREGEYHIRLMSAQTLADDGVRAVVLQMIDGRLENKMPWLYDAP